MVRAMKWTLDIICILLLVLMGAPWTSGFSVYQDRIPNGRAVPHPCKPNYLWRGVGHVNPLGGGDRNAFGVDFLQAGAEWTAELCRKDSDGDGKTNGEELGDPQCIWRKGALPSSNTGITHPGVCDPWTSASCQAYNSWISCDLEDFKCPSLQDPGVRNITLTFPPTAVPNTETNYMCMSFDLPSDDVYHLIATKPAIDNEQVMHHMLLYRCSNTDNTPLMDKPQKCGMEAGSGCDSLIGGWTVGSAGKCYNEKAGFRFGRGHITRVILEFHWNNPELRSDYTDASGMTLFYTTSLRPNDATVFVVGQTELRIPPRQQAVEQIGSCPGSCSRRIITKPVYVIDALNHMHYMGISQKVELFRGGQLQATITNDEVFSYDSPTYVVHDPPIEILPGDEIKTTCVYTSTYKNKTVYYGDGTSDEMCYAFLTVYPDDALPYVKVCVAFGEESLCDRYMNNDGDDSGKGDGDDNGEGDDGGDRGDRGDGDGSGQELPAVINGCNWAEFTDLNTPAKREIFGRLAASCKAFGTCRHECAKLLEEDQFQREPCLRDPRAWGVVKRQMMRSHQGLLAVAYIDSCHLTMCPACQRCPSG